MNEDNILDLKELTYEQVVVILEQISIEKGSAFMPIIIHGLEIRALRRYFAKIYDSIEKNPDQFKTPDNKTFILYTPSGLLSILHWSCIHVQISNTSEGQDIKIFLIDSIGERSIHADLHMELKCDARAIFGNNVTIFLSSYKMQKDISSCSVYAIMFARMLHSLNYGKFSKKYPDFKLFDYLAEHIVPGDSGFKLVHDIPAKLIQADQFVHDSDKFSGANLLSSRVNSKELILSGAFERTKKEVVDAKGVAKTWNCKINQQHRKFFDKYNALSTSGIKEDELTDLKMKYSLYRILPSDVSEDDAHNNSKKMKVC